MLKINIRRFSSIAMAAIVSATMYVNAISTEKIIGPAITNNVAEELDEKLKNLGKKPIDEKLNKKRRV